MRRGTTTRRAISALVALGCVGGLGAAVAGCSSRPGPTPTPTPTVTEEPTPSSTPTPTPTPDASVKPERPEAMDVADSAGAEAAAVYFLQLFPYVAATGDLADWRALSHPECIYCASVATGVEEIFAAGNHSVGGLVSISSVVSAEIDPGRWWSVDVELVESPSVTVDGAGNVVEEFPDTKTYRMTLAVVYETEHWVVRELSHELVG